MRIDIVTLALILNLASCASPAPQGWGLRSGGEVTIVPNARISELVHAPSPRPRIVNFWATWCPPCVAELPELEAFAKAHPEVDVLLINTDLPKRPVASFLQQRGVLSTQNARVNDPDPAGVMGQLVPGWVDAIPYTLIIDQKGGVATAFNRPVNQAMLAEALRGL